MQVNAKRDLRSDVCDDIGLVSVFSFHLLNTERRELKEASRNCKTLASVTIKEVVQTWCPLL